MCTIKSRFEYYFPVGSIEKEIRPREVFWNNSAGKKTRLLFYTRNVRVFEYTRAHIIYKH